MKYKNWSFRNWSLLLMAYLVDAQFEVILYGLTYDYEPYSIH